MEFSELSESELLITYNISLSVMSGGQVERINSIICKFDLANDVLSY